jgi:hypothetical protein
MGDKCVGCLIAAQNFRQLASVLSPLNIHANLHFSLKNQLFACLINAFRHMSALCKLGKGIN